MKKILLITFTFFIFSVANADIKSATLNKLSSAVQSLIPGEGVTEVSLDFNDGDEDQLNFSILGVRDINSTDDSNTFTQFSLMNQEINGEERIIGNLGFGYRKLFYENSFMFGNNAFYDRDLTDGQSRLSLGMEAKASILDITANRYVKYSNSKIVKGDREQVLGGWDYNLTTQIPKAPWARINYNGYKWEADKGSEDLKGNIYSLELDVTKSIEIVASLDESFLGSVDDEASLNINYFYPPRNKTMTMGDGFSNNFYEKANMEHKLREKVRRRNKLVMEIQGAVVMTKK